MKVFVRPFPFLKVLAPGEETVFSAEGLRYRSFVCAPDCRPSLRLIDLSVAVTERGGTSSFRATVRNIGAAPIEARCVLILEVEEES